MLVSVSGCGSFTNITILLCPIRSRIVHIDQAHCEVYNSIRISYSDRITCIQKRNDTLLQLARVTG